VSERPLPRVLFVDDDALLLKAMGRFCAVHCVARTALGLEEGLRAIAEEAPFDFVLFDMNMPDEVGSEFYKRAIKHTELRGRLGVMSGMITTPAIESLAAAGCHVFEKPLKPVAWARLFELARVVTSG
jgi:DNA-binding NtrC family response regulator